jgi:hypothetical protein
VGSEDQLGRNGLLGESWPFYLSRSTIRRTGRLLTPSMPINCCCTRPAAATAVMASAHAGLCGGRLPLPGADCADDDAKLVGATAASQRQMDQRHVAVSAGHKGREVKPDSMLAGATPGRHVVAMREGSRRRAAGPRSTQHRTAHGLWRVLAAGILHALGSETVLRLNIRTGEAYRCSAAQAEHRGGGMSQWSPREAIIMERRHISEGEKRIARQEARVAEVTERGYGQVADRSREVLGIRRPSTGRSNGYVSA